MQLVAQIKGVNEINCLKSAVVLMDIFIRLMNLVGYIFVLQGFIKINLKHISFKKIILIKLFLMQN